MKKGIATLIISIALMTGLSLGTLAATTPTNATNPSPLSVTTATSQTSPAKVQITSGQTSSVKPADTANPVQPKPKAVSKAVKMRNNIEQFFHDKVVTPLKLGWRHLKALHNHKTPSKLNTKK